MAQAIAAVLDLALPLPSAPVSQGRPVLLCLGDSNGAGWIPALTPLVRTEVVGYHRSGMTIGFDNLGDPGLNMLANIERVLAETIAPLGKPVREVLILLGSNDCKAVFDGRLDESLANLEKMVARGWTGPGFKDGMRGGQCRFRVRKSALASWDGLW